MSHILFHLFLLLYFLTFYLFCVIFSLDFFEPFYCFKLFSIFLCIFKLFLCVFYAFSNNKNLLVTRLLSVLKRKTLFFVENLSQVFFCRTSSLSGGKPKKNYVKKKKIFRCFYNVVKYLTNFINSLD